MIHQADTHKLRPTEVCDWVQRTWGLRIARVTVYSILHKQRASLMAGHKDLYQSMQTTQGTDPKPSSSSLTSTDQQSSFTNTHADTENACLDRNKSSGRVNKYRASPNKNKPKSKNNEAKASNNKRSRSSSVMSDGSASSSGSPPLEGAGEGMDSPILPLISDTPHSRPLHLRLCDDGRERLLFSTSEDDSTFCFVI